MSLKLKLIISGVLGLAFSIPSAIMFVILAKGGTIDEPSVPVACIVVTVAVLLVAWYLYVLISIMMVKLPKKKVTK